MTITAQQVLNHAAELLEKGWTQGHYAVDANNNPVEYFEPSACKFCMSGSVRRAAKDLGTPAILPIDLLYDFMDRHTKKICR